MKEKGFVLIWLLFTMVLMAVVFMAFNQRAGLQAKMASNQAQSLQTYLGQSAAVDQALWKLTQDPAWWASPVNKDYTYDGVTFPRTVLKSTLSGYTDALMVSVKAPGGIKAMTAAFRYYISPALPGPKVGQPIYQVASDNFDNTYFAVPAKHIIYKRNAGTGEITEVAGSGISGYSGDGGPAILAQLNRPQGVSVDASGNIFIADTENHCVRKVSSGIISTVAGACEQSEYAGDGGPATNANARLNRPRRVFVDPLGNIYIADSSNNAIRMVDNSGIIRTVAGNGNNGYGGDGGPATLAQLSRPQGIFVDTTGNIFFADTENHCIRLVSSGIISTVAGVCEQNGSGGDGGPAVNARLNRPRDVIADTLGNIYIADANNDKIRKMNSLQIISTVAGIGSAGYSGDGLLATNARLDTPSGICLVSTGIVVSDTNNNCLRQVVPGGIITSLFAPGGLALANARGIALDAIGNLYIADTDNNRIRKLGISGSVNTVAGTGATGFSGDGGLAISAQLQGPQGVFVDAAGNIFIADTDNNSVRKVDPFGIITTVAGISGAVGAFSGDGGPAISARLQNPHGIFVDASGNLFIADTGNNCIRKVDAAGIITTVAGIGGPNGSFSGDGGPAISARLRNPQGIFVDAAGSLFIADTDNSRIRKVNGTAPFNINTIAGTGSSGYSGDGTLANAAQINRPQGVFVDTIGNMYIADTGNQLIRMVTGYDGKIYTLAGNRSAGYNGDNQAAVRARLNGPSSLVMAARRGGLRIFISDTSNDRIRILTYKKVKELYGP